MNIKRTSSFVLGLLICLLVIFFWINYNKGGPVPYPINTGSFYTIGSATIDPKTLLVDIKGEKQPILDQVRSDLPEDTHFIMSIGWSQNDYLEIAKVLHKTIWKDDPDEWHLYRVSFYTGCENPSGKFESADLYYYQEVKVDGKRKYSVRNILIEPEYGYIAWGGDSRYPRPIWGWAEIENISNFPAERALELADQQGGGEFRNKESNDCRITVDMWPWGYDRNDWRVSYSDNVDLTNIEIWVPLE